MGASLLTLFVNLGVQTGFGTILIAHILFNVSFVVVTVKARLAGLDSRLEEAAMDLYANEWQTFRRITLPLAAPGHLRRRAAGVRAVLRRLHHHELQLRQHDHLPDVRVGGRAARRPAAGQRHRDGDVRARAARGGGRRVGQARPACADPRRSRALADAEPAVFWLDDPAAPDPAPGAGRGRRVRPGRRRRGLHRPLDGARARERGEADDVVVLDAGRSGAAASGRNGGFCAASLTHGAGNGYARWPAEMPELDRLGMAEPRRHRGGRAALRDRLRLPADRRARRGHRSRGSWTSCATGRPARSRRCVAAAAAGRRGGARGAGLTDLPRRPLGAATPRRWWSPPGWPGVCARPPSHTACGCSSTRP